MATHSSVLTWRIPGTGEPGGPVKLAGPLGTPLGLAQRKRASPRGEAGTSGFITVSDSARRVPAELGQESHLPDWASLELSPSVESCGCGLGPSPVRLG